MSKKRTGGLFNPFDADVDQEAAEKITDFEFMEDWRQGERLRREQAQGFSSVNRPLSFMAELADEGSAINRRRSGSVS